MLFPTSHAGLDIQSESSDFPQGIVVSPTSEWALWQLPTFGGRFPAIAPIAALALRCLVLPIRGCL